MREQFSMYVLKLKGDLVWQTAGPDRTLNVEQLDAFTFAKCLEEFAAEIRKAAESYE
jgi:hypothetical protein